MLPSMSSHQQSTIVYYGEVMLWNWWSDVVKLVL